MGPKWLRGTRVHFELSPTVAMPFPQSLPPLFFFDTILAFFLVSLMLSPAPITSEVSVLQLGQYLVVVVVCVCVWAELEIIAGSCK
jgi:hypothetical protein